jgi:hypothetical protein
MRVTRRVELLEGEPENMTNAEMMILKMRYLIGKTRPSCQILSEEDQDQAADDREWRRGQGPRSPTRAEDHPPPVWVERPY